MFETTVIRTRFLRGISISAKKFQSEELCQLYKLSDFLSIPFDDFGIMVIPAIPEMTFSRNKGAIYWKTNCKRTFPLLISTGYSDFLTGRTFFETGNSFIYRQDSGQNEFRAGRNNIDFMYGNPGRQVSFLCCLPSDKWSRQDGRAKK